MTPGYFKTNTQALYLREMIRLRGWWRLPMTFLLSRLMRPAGAIWMPSLCEDTDCSQDRLTNEFWQATEKQRAAFARMGFSEVRFTQVQRHLHPLVRDNGGVFYLDPSRSCIASVLYCRVHTPAPVNSDVTKITLTFTAAYSAGSLNCTNDAGHFDPPPGHHVAQFLSDDPERIYESFQQQLRERSETARSFADNQCIREWLDATQLTTTQHRIDRGLFVRLTEPEVAALSHIVPPPLP